MTEKNEVDTEAGAIPVVVDVIDKITTNDRASAIDAIKDMLFAKSADAMAGYKKVVANTYFQEPVADTPEEPSNETDNGSN